MAVQSVNQGSHIGTAVRDRRARHREADRRVLYSAAEGVFARLGYQASSIKAIAEAAGFSTGGVYQFCRSKADLYLQILEDQWRQYFAALTPVLGSGRAVEDLMALTRITLEYFEARRDFLRMHLADRPRFTGRVRASVARRVEHHKHRLRDQVAAVMRAGVADRTFRAADPEFLTSAYFAILNTTMLEAVAPSPRPSPPAPAAAATGPPARQPRWGGTSESAGRGAAARGGGAPRALREMLEREAEGRVKGTVRNQPRGDEILMMFLCGAAHPDKRDELCHYVNRLDHS